MIDRINGFPQVSSVTPETPSTSASEGFGTAFRQELEKTAAQNAPVQQQPSSTPVFSSGIAFSKHAILRAAERGIDVTPELADQLADSVERAQAKGATNILAFDATRAFIINVPNSKVITTISQDEMKDNIFTNIDGAVLL